MVFWIDKNPLPAHLGPSVEGEVIVGNYPVINFYSIQIVKEENGARNWGISGGVIWFPQITISIFDVFGFGWLNCRHRGLFNINNNNLKRSFASLW